MDLALILEFGSRQRLLALGRISALLPSADNDLVRLNMEAMGVIDFDAGTAAIDAELVDSRLAHKFPITGSAALRAGFGDGPSFVLSVGGFNPRFAAPATVPALKRVAIALSSGNNPRLVCEAYFAITSNTVQFGANACAVCQRGRLQRGGRRRLRRAGAARAAALHRRFPRQAAVEARLAQPVHGVAERRARRAAAAARQRQGDVRDPVVRLQRALRHDAGERGAAAAAAGGGRARAVDSRRSPRRRAGARSAARPRRTASRCAACRRRRRPARSCSTRWAS